MTWRLLHITEDKADNGDSVIYNRKTVGEWSDEIVQQAAQKVKQLELHSTVADVYEVIKEFLPEPIKEAL